jgi:hypothetical protein
VSWSLTDAYGVLHHCAYAGACEFTEVTSISKSSDFCQISIRIKWMFQTKVQIYRKLTYINQHPNRHISSHVAERANFCRTIAQEESKWHNNRTRSPLAIPMLKIRGKLYRIMLEWRILNRIELKIYTDSQTAPSIVIMLYMSTIIRVPLKHLCLFGTETSRLITWLIMYRTQIPSFVDTSIILMTVRSKQLFRTLYSWIRHR